MSGQYSYLSVEHGLETHYKEVSEINAHRYNGGGVWTAYKCFASDVLPNEKYVAKRRYTQEILKADSIQELTNKVFDWEYYHH